MKENYIKLINLIPHPEGGYFRETYRSANLFDNVNGEFPDGRCYCASIYYLLESGQFSKFHRIKSDEIWHFYDGSPLDLFYIYNEQLHHTILGRNIDKGMMFQQIVPAGAWMAAKLSVGDYSLVGCDTAPGFEYKDFEIADKTELTNQFPIYSKIINELT